MLFKMRIEREMLIYSDIYTWEGWGGRLRLGRGKCRLYIFDLSKGDTPNLAYMRPFIVIVSDVPESSLSVRSCAGHIATKVVADFHINPQRMMYIEYYSATEYGKKGLYTIPARYDTVSFSWFQDKAVTPTWRTLPLKMRNNVRSLIYEASRIMRKSKDLAEDN